MPVFEVKSDFVHTLISTRQILEINNNKLQSINFNFIANVIYGDFKGHINKSELTIFTIIDVYGKEFNFQMETGKSSIGLIYSIDTIRKLKTNAN